MTSPVLELFKSHLERDTSDERYIFNARRLWRAEDYLSEKMNHILSPFVLEYHSYLKPLFLFEIKDTSVLNFFDFALIRDGAIGLMDFFLSNPTPEKFTCHLIVHRKLAIFVPKEWRDQILFYEALPSITHKSEETSSDIFLTAFVDPFNINIEHAREVIQSLSDRYENAYCLFTYPPSWASGAVERQTEHYFELTRLVCEKFSNRARFVNLTNLNSLALTKKDFLDLKRGPVFYADSYLDQLFFSQGAFNLDEESFENAEGVDFAVSPYHKWKIVPFRDLPRKDEIINVNLWVQSRKELLERANILSPLDFSARSSKGLEDLDLGSDVLKSFVIDALNQMNDKK